jgi:hypothetical protein
MADEQSYRPSEPAATPPGRTAIDPDFVAGSGLTRGERRLIGRLSQVIRFNNSGHVSAVDGVARIGGVVNGRPLFDAGVASATNNIGMISPPVRHSFSRFVPIEVYRDVCAIAAAAGDEYAGALFERDLLRSGSPAPPPETRARRRVAPATAI